LALFLTLAAGIVSPSVALAQTLYGSIVGQVTDPQGAALPGPRSPPPTPAPA
jgi:uncharacterized glyoxalase superfamily protein PhnB